MADTRDLLVEIGTEELPPKALEKLSLAFAQGIRAQLEKEQLEFAEIIPYATPRRLAVMVTALADTQPEKQIQQRGPSVKAAFDDAGNPTKAAEGFAKSIGLGIDQLERMQTDDGEYLVFRSTEVGQSTQALVPGMVEAALDGLPIPKRMRWGDGDAEFVRPVHWVVLLYGTEVIEAEILGVTASNLSRGHRFHHPQPIKIKEPSAYGMAHYSQGHVIAEFDTRRENIRAQVEETAAELGGKADIDESLLDEVTALVEWPVAIAGDFEARFLDLPQEVLIATLKIKQKCFYVLDKDDKILPHFITISNIESSNPATVKAGNERVVTPRLADAAFFYTNDLKHPLDERVADLKNVIFQEKLGTLTDRSERVSRLAGHIGIAIGLSPDEVKLAKRAGLLAKADLLTEMVGEYPELQGVMGGYYAQRYGEADGTATAIAEQYKPRFAGDSIPESRIGQALSLSDRLDVLVGIFGIGQAPTGDKDPFALRRAALGAMRIMIEAEMDLDPKKLLKAVAAEISVIENPDEIVSQVHAFMMDRLRAYYADMGITPDAFEAVLAREPEHPFDFDRRVRAINDFRKLPEAASLAAANKRIQNILKKVDGQVPETLNDELYKEDAEWDLATRVTGISANVMPLLDSGEYSTALTQLAGLRDSVDAFFEAVMVMDDDLKVRANRLALLGKISSMFLRVADISCLQITAAED